MGDVTSCSDVKSLNKWFDPLINRYLKDTDLIDQLKEDILKNVITIQMDSAARQELFLRQHVKPGSWIRIRELASEFRLPNSDLSASDEGETIFRITDRTHINVILPYFRCGKLYMYFCSSSLPTVLVLPCSYRDALNIFQRFLSDKSEQDVSTENKKRRSPPKPQARQLLSSSGEPLTNLVIKYRVINYM